MMSVPKQSSIGPYRVSVVFILTYPRSGSKLLQGIINTIPGYCLRGENYSMLFYLFLAVRQCSMVKAHLPFDKSSEGDEAGPRSPLFGVQNFDQRKERGSSVLRSCATHLQTYPTISLLNIWTLFSTHSLGSVCF